MTGDDRSADNRFEDDRFEDDRFEDERDGTVVAPTPLRPVEQVLDEVIEYIVDTRAMPMSSTIKVNKDELLDLLEDAKATLPAELAEARWLLKEKEDFLAQARREREDIIGQGRSEVSRMVERQEVVKAAEARARLLVDEARDEARQLRRQVEDYCDQKLASFEVVLDKTARTVQQGREKLLGTAVDPLADAAPPPPGE